MIEGNVPSCPKCGCARSSRVKRKGLMQTLVLHRFGLYPWECVGCRGVFSSKNRGLIRRTRRTMVEEHQVHLAPKVQLQTKVQFQTRLTSVSVYPENLKF